MAVRDRVKTMVSKTCSTLDGHPEVKTRRPTQHFWLTKGHNPHPLRLARLLLIVKLLLYARRQQSPWIQRIMASLRRVSSSDYTLQANASDDLLDLVVCVRPLQNRCAHKITLYMSDFNPLHRTSNPRGYVLSPIPMSRSTYQNPWYQFLE